MIIWVYERLLGGRIDPDGERVAGLVAYWAMEEDPMKTLVELAEVGEAEQAPDGEALGQLSRRLV